MIANPIILNAVEEEEADPNSQWGGRCRPLVEAMTKANVSPSLIYASIKTGRMVTVENKKLLSGDDIAEWEGYCAEYDELASEAGV